MPQTKQGLTRCAVCKIDLKGKFVFIDEQIEHLLGVSKENLFGKPLQGFLNESSVVLLENILNVRNNYETFYDATTLTFISHDNQLYCLKVITSLNFIAGNPVNFQLIIDTENVPIQQSLATSIDEIEVQEIIKNLNTDILSDTTNMVKYFHSISEADSSAMYFANEQQLDLVATSDSSTLDNIVEKALTETTQIHFDYAVSGEVYSFLNEKNVSNAIEKYKEAPNEFLLPLVISDGIRCLIRLKYSTNYNSSQLKIIYKKLTLATSFIEKTLALQSELSEVSDSVDIKFTIGFLESINIPAFLTNSEGEIIGYNPTMNKFFSEKILSGSYYNLFKSLAKYNKGPFLGTISDFVNSAYDQSEPTEKQMNLSLNKSISKKMTILKIGDKETDRSACFVFAPK